MNKHKYLYRNQERRQLLFKKSHFILLMFICIIAIVAFTMVNIQFASAGTSGNKLMKTPEHPMESRNYTEILPCNGCHYDNSSVTITFTVYDETPSEITYFVSGSSETFDGIEGWGVFDDLQNKKFGGQYKGYFTLPKDGRTYKVFWVDNGTVDPPDPDHPGGSTYEEFTTPTNAPSPPIISGPDSGYTDTSYSYEFNSTDPEGDNIFYFIKWGDGEEEDWFGPNPSGEPVTKSHSWSEPGNYTIEAKARDTNQQESDWSTFTVNISSKPYEPKLKIRLKMISMGKVRVTIQNTGSEGLSDIKYNITVNGGIIRLIKRIDIKANGTIENLAAGEKKVVSTPDKLIKLRLCVAKVTVTATVDGKTFEHNQFVVVIGRFVFARPILLLRP